jgi:PAS domain S-box-containing protein
MDGANELRTRRLRCKFETPPAVALPTFPTQPFRFAYRSKTMHSAETSKAYPENWEVICTYDLSGNFTFINSAGERLLGYSRSQICNLNIRDFVVPELTDYVIEQSLRSLMRPIGAVYEIEIIGKGGRRIPLEISSRAILDADDALTIRSFAVPVGLGGFPRPDNESGSREDRCTLTI